MNFASEFGEDKWIAENLPLPDKGFYVDVGANQPGAGSNTAFLRSKGWLGLAVDANPDFAKHWAGIEGTLFVAGIVSDEPVVRFDFKQIAGHSRVDNTGRFFATTPLDRLLQTVKPAMSRIDLLSIDVEGHEFNVLKSLNLWRWQPSIIVSEYSTSGIGLDFRVGSFLETHALGYKEVHRTEANQIFRLIEDDPRLLLLTRNSPSSGQ